MDEFYDYVITKPELEDALAHYGVKGMRWGHRKSRYTNSDGSLNERGQIKKKRLEKKRDREINRAKRDIKYETGHYQRGVDKAKRQAAVKNANAKAAKEISNFDKGNKTYSDSRLAKKQAAKSAYLDKKAARASDAATRNVEAMKNIHSANRRYTKAIEDRYNSKISALSDPSVKKSDYYKKARKDYNYQKSVGSMYGNVYARLTLAADEQTKSRANEKPKKKKKR